jgi:AraC family transcriptional regulator
MVPQLPRTSSYGEITKSREVGGFVLTETTYRPCVRTPRHSHELGYLYTVLDGSFTESLGKIERDGQPLTLALRPAGEAHSHGCGSRGARLLNLYPVCLDRFEGGSNLLREPDDLQGAAVPWLVSRLYREFQRTDGASSLAIEGLALEILAEASRSPAVPGERRPPRWLEQTRDLIHSRFAENLALDDLAEAAGVHPSYLARTFRVQYRCTVGEYVRQLRVEFACRAISRSDAPLAAIALDAGFADQSHFTKTFKRLTGVTPSQFRTASRSL